MKTKLKILFALALCLSCFGAIGQLQLYTNLIGSSDLVFLNPNNPADAAIIKRQHLRQPIWVCFEEDGKVYMHGFPRDMSQGELDPEFVKSLTVKIQGSDSILFGNCCTTNVQIKSSFTGTIQVGDKFFTVKDLNSGFLGERQHAYDSGVNAALKQVKADMENPTNSDISIMIFNRPK